MAWYKGHFPLQRNAEKITERYGVQAQTFESSPYYMYHPQAAARIARDLPDAKDRKSTRLNSSHANISYAVFCLKKKKKQQADTALRIGCPTTSAHEPDDGGSVYYALHIITQKLKD